ncbi:aldehyde dehydrogenase family protein [Hydrogenobaculum acidophilum]
MIVKKPILGGEFLETTQKLDVIYPYDNSKIGETYTVDASYVEKAIEKAKIGLKKLSELSSYEKSEILFKTSELLRKNKEEIAKTIVYEVGKTIKEARVEVDRAIETFKFSAEEAKRIKGETYEVDAHPNGKSKFGFYIRVPAGIVVAISPFNFPLNLTAHKVGPAIGAGCPVIVKPSEKTPLSPIMMGEFLLEAGLPKEAISVLPGFGDLGKALTMHKDVRVVSFTGSKMVGELIARQAGIKKLVLELGSNSALVVHKDGDLEKAATKAVQGGFSMAGQVCISIQRIFVHEEVLDKFLRLLEEKISNIKIGDPMDETVDMGPMIDKAQVERVQNWIKEAIEKGAKLIQKAKNSEHIKGTNYLLPTLLIDVNKDSAIFKEEAFAPVININKYKDIKEVIDVVNEGDYGLQIGVYTNDIKVAMEFIRNCEVGGVNINEGPNFRVDHMPYGGFKYSGIGREGPAFAIEDYTEIKNVVISL